jgi:hypothetical protein
MPQTLAALAYDPVAPVEAPAVKTTPNAFIASSSSGHISAIVVATSLVIELSLIPTAELGRR